VPCTSELRALSGWGRATRSVSAVTRPRSAEAVAEALAETGPRGALARGLGRAYGDAAQNAGGRVVDMTALTRIGDLDAATGRITVEAGVSLAALVAHVLPRGWFPAVVPGTRWVTVGGALAADVHGKNHHVDGGFADHTPAFELVTPQGDVVTATQGDGGDAWTATVGGLGLSGVITRATLQLTPVRSPFVREEVSRATDFDELLGAMARDDRAHRYSVAWVDCLARSGRGVLMHGDHDDEPAPATPPPPPRLRAPRAVPGGLLTRPTVRAFNALWYALKRPRTRRVPLPAFFWPLDGIDGWNRLYGPGGLVQYQCVVPHGHEHVVQAILERARSIRAAPTLAVLKRLGPGTAPLSFPLPGWTLALDLPAHTRGLDRLLDGVDALVAEAGGRVYLAKDARLRPAALAAMQPALSAWREARARLDPRGVMRSDLARRLELV
jgi:decaprenylphospho-beta-D-ribofuranose 2-oxidase